MTKQIEVLDRGNYYIEGGKAKPFLDFDGLPVPGLLDGKGGRLAPDAEPSWLRFNVGEVGNNSADEPFAP